MRKMRYNKLGGGERPPPPVLVTDCDAVLLAGRRAFRGRDISRVRGLVHEDRARNRGTTRQVVVGHRRVPTTTGDVERDQVVAGRGAPAHLTRSGRTGGATDLARDVGAVLDGVGEERLLGRHEVT